MPRARKTPAPVVTRVDRSATKVKTTAGTSATRRPRGRTTTAAPASEPLPSAHEVAKLAYELFVCEGGAHGRDLEHWLQAERLLRQERNAPA